MGFCFLPESSVELRKVIRYMVLTRLYCWKRSTRDMEHSHLLRIMVKKTGLCMTFFLPIVEYTSAAASKIQLFRQKDEME